MKKLKEIQTARNATLAEIERLGRIQAETAALERKMLLKADPESEKDLNRLAGIQKRNQVCAAKIPLLNEQLDTNEKAIRAEFEIQRSEFNSRIYRLMDQARERAAKALRPLISDQGTVERLSGQIDEVREISRFDVGRPPSDAGVDWLLDLLFSAQTELDSYLDRVRPAASAA